MIAEFVTRFDAARETLRATFSKKAPADYKEIVEAVVRICAGDGDLYGRPNAAGIHEINDGGYQGTLLYIIPATTYRPHTYWYVFVDYGSCSGCDTLEAIRSDGRYDGLPPSQKQVDDYMTLALHIVQGIKAMDTEDAA